MVGDGGDKEIQTDGQRNRPTEESSAGFVTAFIGEPLRCLGIGGPACGKQHTRTGRRKRRREERTQELQPESGLTD